MAFKRGKTRPPDLRTRERRAYVFALRKGGASYNAIFAAVSQRFAGQLPKTYDAARVCKEVQLELRAITDGMQDDVVLVKQLELERLDEMTLSVWPRARAGDDQGIMSMLRLMERRARMLGLDGPLKVAQTDSDGQDLPVHEAGWSPEFCTEVLGLLALHSQQGPSINGHTATNGTAHATNGAPDPLS